jgi:hypothetical protein
MTRAPIQHQTTVGILLNNRLYGVWGAGSSHSTVGAAQSRRQKPRGGKQSNDYRVGGVAATAGEKSAG